MNAIHIQQLAGIVVFLLLFVVVDHPTEALRCYTCSYVATSPVNKACINEPTKVDGAMWTSCKKKFCTIQRTEMMSPRGQVSSFLRGCEDNPLNEVFEDPTFKTYFSSCNTDLCNDGDGQKTSDYGLSADGPPGPNLIVPGLSGRAPRPTGHSTATICLAAVAATGLHRVISRT